METLKREEKQKLRQQTAEDFHDDLGNKLTRITVLSDVLHAKIDEGETDQKKLVEQIQQNAAELYHGTKDLIWALDPETDNLYQILVHIKEIGLDLFQDIDISFEFDNIDVNLKNVKLPMEYSRNITMIFKEQLNNVLKHAGAKNVAISTYLPDDTSFIIKLTDDGKGYDNDTASRGQGVKNMKARAKRIGAEVTIQGQKGVGTIVTLTANLNNKK